MPHAVLVIEDEQRLARNIQAFLQHHDCEVRLAHTAADGLACARERRPDLVVLDHGLPDQTGLQALARLRALDATLPVLMVTGEPSIDMEAEAMKAGAVDFMSKPLALSRLLIRVQQVLRTHRQLADDPLAPGSPRP